VTRSLARLKNILPEVVEDRAYSDDIMFGCTPFKQAIEKAAIRFIDPQHQEKKKVLLIISSGKKEKLCFQVNHSFLLENVLELIFTG
jgi:hypothetical protein